MTPTTRDRTRWRHAPLSSVLAFLIGLLMIQLWLLSGALEVALGGDHEMLAPVIGVSGLCSLAAWGLLRLTGRGS